MGYFSNGMEGQIYEERHCSKCVHQNGPDGKTGCVVWLAHMLRNCKECNNEAGKNQQCLMFLDKRGVVMKEHALAALDTQERLF